MALDKAALQSTLQGIFEDLTQGKTAVKAAATQMADAIDAYVKTAIATVQVPAGTFLISAMAGVPNPAPVPLMGSPVGVPPGGLT